MEKYAIIEKKLLEELKGQMTKASYDAWVRDIKIYNIDEELKIIYLGIPELPGRKISQTLSVLQSRYIELLEMCFKSIMMDTYRIIIKRMDEYALARPREEKDTTENDVKRKSTPFEPQYTFDAFVVGQENRLAYAAALAVANSPAESYNPVYIYGASGMGKTHLLQAIGGHLSEFRPELTVVYVSAENFTNEFVSSIKKNTTFEFKEKYRNVDVLLIDDIQFFGRTKESQEEFFHTFNDLYHAKKQIVISSDCEPDKLDNLQERLKTRFQWNLIADIQPPNYETRVAILLKYAEIKGVEVNKDVYDVIQLIASNFKSNVRELEGALNRVINFAKLLNEDITVDFAKNTLTNIIREEKNEITPEKIKRVVSKVYNVKETDLSSNKRQKNISEARQVTMYLMREMTNLSLHRIGEEVGGKHHTTVLHACNRVEEQLNTNRNMKDIVRDLKLEIEGSTSVI